MRYLKKYENFGSETFKDIVDQVFVDLVDKNISISSAINNRIINLFEYTSTNNIERKDTLDTALKAISDKKVYNGNIVQLYDSRQNSDAYKLDEDIVSVIETANDYLKSKGYEFITMEVDGRYYKDVCNYN